VSYKNHDGSDKVRIRYFEQHRDALAELREEAGKD
jgi:hypothetical protein